MPDADLDLAGFLSKSERDPAIHPDRVLAALAFRQWGNVSTLQLDRLGITPRQRHYRIERGRLHRRLHRVYGVGHVPRGCESRWMAGVLACGRPAVLSHISAGALWGLIRDGGTAIHVSVPRSRAGVRGVRLHRTTTLTALDRKSHLDIPVTGVSRTLVDLAGCVDRRALERALDEAAIRYEVAAQEIDAAISRAPNARGVRLLHVLLEEGRLGCTLTRSELEERFLALVRRCAIPEPELNVRLRSGLTYEVDFVWREQRVVVEVDGRAYHQMARAFERDRARDADLLAAGWPVIRYTWAKVTREPRWVERTLRAALERGGRS